MTILNQEMFLNHFLPKGNNFNAHSLDFMVDIEMKQSDSIQCTPLFSDPDCSISNLLPEV